MAARDELLAAVLADFGPASCGVYADHLIELGDPRGEFIACELAIDAARRARRPVAEAHARRQQLFEAHARTWWPWELVYHRRIGGTHVVHGTRLGFLHRVAAYGHEIDDVRALLDREPVRELELRHHAGGLADHFAARLERLSLVLEVAPSAFAELVQLPALRQLPELSMRELECPDLVALGGGLPGVRRLELRIRPLDRRRLAELLRWPVFPRLESLTLMQCGLTVAGLEQLLAAGPFPELVELDLRWNPFDEAGVLELCRQARLFPALRYLQVSVQRPGELARRTLRETDWPSGRVVFGPRPDRDAGWASRSR